MEEPPVEDGQFAVGVVDAAVAAGLGSEGLAGAEGGPVGAFVGAAGVAAEAAEVASATPRTSHHCLWESFAVLWAAGLVDAAEAISAETVPVAAQS